MASSSSNVVGVHYRVGKKIGEGSFGVIFEGTNLLNNQQVAIKFVSSRAESIPIISEWREMIASFSAMAFDIRFSIQFKLFFLLTCYLAGTSEE